ncbi:MAG: hypothetical protein PHH49_00985 [Candidatus Omnitrophica bacterium]|nr:hypothetical protein [Candidatus Omnitrophota bacterium]MDD5487527.1 hypothetical protein [Candidatus Omnitrophota bacterium]
MVTRARIFVGGLVLISYVMTSAGCAPLWFLAGAGAAATVLVATENDKKHDVSTTEKKTK